MTDRRIIPQRTKLEAWDKDDGGAAASRTDEIREEMSPAGRTVCVFLEEPPFTPKENKTVSLET